MAEVVDRKPTFKWAAAGAWAAAAGGYVLYARWRGLAPLEAADELRSTLADNWWGPVLFTVAYVLRPLVLFPASVLTILGGLAFGVGWGVVFTLVAANASMAASYFVGRFFGSERTLDRIPNGLAGMIERARRAPFETTLIMRLIYLPFDLVGYVAGFLQLHFGRYASGSFLGTLPGTIAFVGFGASIERLDEGRPSFDLRVLLASVGLAVVGTLVSRRLGRNTSSNQNGALP